MIATRKLWPFLRPYWRWALLAPVLMALEVSMDLMVPRLIQRIIDQGITPMDLTVVRNSGLLMVLVAVVGMIGGVGCTIYAVLAAQYFGADLRQTLFGKVQTFAFANLDQLETGGLITRLTNDVTQVQEVVMILLRIMVRSPLLMVGSVIMAFLTSPRLALLFVVLVPVVVVVLRWVIGRAYPLYSRVQARLDAINTVMQENLAGVRVVKAFAREPYEVARFGGANDAFMLTNIRAVRTVAVTMPAMMLALNGGIVAALWVGGVQVNAGGMQVGQVVAFINYLMQALMSLMMVSMLVMRVSRAEASAQRIDEVLSSVPAVLPPAQAARVPALRGRVEFDHVSFGYGAAEETTGEHTPVLVDVSFVAEPGETVAILGATGSGKSTLIHLVPRFYDVTGGAVRIDGVDVRDLDEETLRRTVAVALQEAILFSGTIRDNIRYGRPEASDDEVMAAAQHAQADAFIRGLPGGYDALVGQRGVNLSGGQKQRLAIARALLMQPAVLVLDDSTSAVDVATEAKIQAALASMRRRSTVLIVAQRISTVLNADKILVLEKGRIAAQGTHAELLATSPIYREIYESQLQKGVMAHAGE